MSPAPRCMRVTAVTRAQLGKRVRDAWIRWARTQPDPKPSWLVPYEELSAPDREADMLIGEDLFAYGWEAGSSYGREHIVQVSAGDTARLRAWLAHPNGSFSAGRVVFNACGGGVLVRTQPCRAGDQA